MTTNPPVSPSQPENKATFKPIVITLLCSFLLAGGSCFGALKALKYNGGVGGWWLVFMALFAAATVAFIVACLLLLVRAVLNVLRKEG